MLAFLTAYALFLALHSVPAIPAIREGIIRRTGLPLYFSVYSLLSILALVWVFASALALDYIPLWDLQPWHAAITFVLAPIGLFLVCAGLLSANPLSISLRNSPMPGSIAAITRHPVPWGFALWALGHIAANGDVRSLLLFGGLAAFPLATIPMIEKRAKRRLGPSWMRLAEGTSILPMAAVVRGRRMMVDRPMALALLIVAAVVAWLLLAGGHAMLVGADPISVFQ